jgi:hypothetical protein
MMDINLMLFYEVGQHPMRTEENGTTNDFLLKPFMTVIHSVPS